MANDAIFLTTDQATEAICIDLRQYDPQIMLLCNILRLIFNDANIVRRGTRLSGAWVRIAGNRKMRWMEGTALVAFACDAIKKNAPTPSLLASICAQVFRTNAFATVTSESAAPGIWIETGMEAYACKQCGRCCRTLDYHKALKHEDVRRWRALGRNDILEWVGVFHTIEGKTTYRIWINPKTHMQAATCPFLKEVSNENRCYCMIHEVKPKICRQYPVSRKHGLLTGCPGFVHDKKTA